MAMRFYDPMHGLNLLFYYVMALIGKLAVESQLGTKLMALIRKICPTYSASGDASAPVTCQPQTTKKFFNTNFDHEVSTPPATGFCNRAESYNPRTDAII